MKKAQIQQIFIYIFAIIVAGLILYFGFTLIPKVIGLFCNVETGNLVTSVETEIAKVGDFGYGTMRTINVPSSCGINYVCFVGDNPDFSKVFDQRARDIIKLRSEKNNFFIVTDKKDNPVQYLNIEDINLKGVLCIRPKGNVITFKAENKGDYVEIS